MTRSGMRIEWEWNGNGNRLLGTGEGNESVFSASLAIRIAERSSIVIEHSSSTSVRTCGLWQNG